MTATRTRPAVFVSELHRASAQRGRLDPLFQDLSDHWTRILQRLYPVWALIGPGLSDPGHIELRSRSIYLDSDELLGPRAQIATGQLEPRAVLRCFGVALHETFHAKHTKRWALEHDLALADSSDPAERQLAVDRRLLEEPRMEAHGVREFAAESVRGRFVRRALEAAVVDVILPRFAQQLIAAGLAGQPLTRDMAGRASVYLQARTHYGVVDPAVLAGLTSAWRRVLGDTDLRALDDLYARLLWIADGELEALDDAARAYREIIGAPDPPQSGEGEESGEPGADTQPARSSETPASDGEPQSGDIGSLADALAHALEHARAGQLEQLDEDLDLGRLLGEARDASRPGPRGHGSGTGLPSGRMPDRGVDRPPFPDEIQQARRYATRLRQAITQGTKQIDKRTPGGRFDGRAYARGQAQRASGQPVSAHPWQITRQVRAPIEAPHVGLVIDSSGSMGAYEYALGPIAWILTDGLRQIGGRCASALFGNGAELLADGAAPLPLVPGISTGGGTAFAGDAIELVSEQLEMTNPRRPRFLYVLSDGGWADTQAGVQKIRWLAEHAVPTVHLSIGIAPLSVECDRITVITDPADALDHIAADTVAALRAPTDPHPQGAHMPDPHPALAPAPALFDVTAVTAAGVDGTLARVPLDQLELAENPRKAISPEGIERLAAMLMRLGQLAPCLGWRPAPDRPVHLYDGQRRLLAAQASESLAGGAGFEGLAPVRSLVVLLLDHEPGREEIMRIQAQSNRSEELTLVDQQAQFGDCWQARAGLPEADRIAAVCADLGISPKKAHNLRRQLTLPEAIRARVAERPAGGQLSATLANRLADMHDIAPKLTAAVATRITSPELHDGALRDLGAFVHRTLVEDEHAYAVRIDDGARLDAVEQIARARTQLTGADRRQLAGILDCPADKLDRELDGLATRARMTACKLRVDGALRERARTGRYAYVHERGADFAAGIWVIDPVFMLDAIREQLQAGEDAVARVQSYFAGAGLHDPELRAAGEQDRAQRADARARQIEATRSNLGLGHDLRAGLIDPSDAQLQALKAIVCHLLARHQRELIAYGAGWSDRERQQPVGDSGRHEPRRIDAITDAELERALADPDPLRAIAGLVASWSAAFVLDPDGVTRTKALGSERMGRKLRDALPSGQHPLRSAVWEFVRPMLSPRLVELHRDAFVVDDRPQSTVDLDAHRSESSLEELDIGEQDADAA